MISLPITPGSGRTSFLCFLMFLFQVQFSVECADDLPFVVAFIPNALRFLKYSITAFDNSERQLAVSMIGRFDFNPCSNEPVIRLAKYDGEVFLSIVKKRKHLTGRFWIDPFEGFQKPFHFPSLLKLVLFPTPDVTEPPDHFDPCLTIYRVVPTRLYIVVWVVAGISCLVIFNVIRVVSETIFASLDMRWCALIFLRSCCVSRQRRRYHLICV